MPCSRSRDLVSDFAGGLEIVTRLDHLDAECTHRGIFLDAVSDRDDNCRRNTVVSGGKPNRLPVIPSRRRDHAVWLSLGATKLIEIDETTANLEGAGGR